MRCRRAFLPEPPSHPDRRRPHRALAEPATRGTRHEHRAPCAARPRPRRHVQLGRMRPDLMHRRYAADGLMPRTRPHGPGRHRGHGLEQDSRRTPGRLVTMATGAWPGTTAARTTPSSTCAAVSPAPRSFAFHGNGTSPGSDPTAVLERRAWPTPPRRPASTWRRSSGPRAQRQHHRADRRTSTPFYSQRGVLDYPLDTTQQASAAKFGLSYQWLRSHRASGWTNVPTPPSPGGGVRPPMQTTLTVNTTFASQNPTRTYRPVHYASRAFPAEPYTSLSWSPARPTGRQQGGGHSVARRRATIKADRCRRLHRAAAGESAAST
jgi:hypothetical protein